MLLRLTEILEPYYRIPAVLLYRPLSPQRLLQCIQERGRKSEQSADIGFLDALRDKFEEWIGTWTRSPVIHVDEHMVHEGPFDLVFIDADKAPSPQYLEWALRLTRPGSIIVIDNSIRHGRALQEEAAQDEQTAGMVEYNRGSF